MARVLVVDDDPSILKTLDVLLSTEGHKVTTVGGGEEACELIIGAEFDLMISDIRMNPITGMDLLKLAHERRPSMMVIMLTAYGQVETAVEALQMGAFDYVKKPFGVNSLLTTVKRALQCREYMKKH